MAAVTKTQLSELQKRLSAGISKFRLPLLIFAAGLLLMLLPTGKRSTQAVQTAAQAAQTLQSSVKLSQALEHFRVARTRWF